jgi:hypothetical protein
MGYLTNEGAESLLDGSINWGSHTIKARLSLTSETPGRDVTAMTSLGLSATDVTLGSKTGPSKNTTTDRVVYSCGNITFSSVAAGPEVDKIIVFRFVTNDADSIPIAVVDISPARTPNGEDINLAISGDGLFYTQE